MSAFWTGIGPKMVECATKGAVLLFAKELLMDASTGLGMSKTASGVVAGAGGGVCQTVVMGPCTFLVTAVVNGGKDMSVSHALRTTWRDKGVAGFYPGGIAIAFRQASNWASRQGFTEAARSRVQIAFHNDPNAKLTKSQEVLSGIIGDAESQHIP